MEALRTAVAALLDADLKLGTALLNVSAMARAVAGLLYLQPAASVLASSNYNIRVALLELNGSDGKLGLPDHVVLTWGMHGKQRPFLNAAEQEQRESATRLHAAIKLAYQQSAPVLPVVQAVAQEEKQLKRKRPAGSIIPKLPVLAAPPVLALQRRRVAAAPAIPRRSFSELSATLVAARRAAEAATLALVEQTCTCGQRHNLRSALDSLLSPPAGSSQDLLRAGPLLNHDQVPSVSHLEIKVGNRGRGVFATRPLAKEEDLALAFEGGILPHFFPITPYSLDLGGKGACHPFQCCMGAFVSGGLGFHAHTYHRSLLAPPPLTPLATFPTPPPHHPPLFSTQPTPSPRPSITPPPGELRR
jgi:hypothetical protein